MEICALRCMSFCLQIFDCAIVWRRKRIYRPLYVSSKSFDSRLVVKLGFLSEGILATQSNITR